MYVDLSAFRVSRPSVVENLGWSLDALENLSALDRLSAICDLNMPQRVARKHDKFAGRKCAMKHNGITTSHLPELVPVFWNNGIRSMKLVFEMRN